MVGVGGSNPLLQYGKYKNVFIILYYVIITIAPHLYIKFLSTALPCSIQHKYRLECDRINKYYERMCVKKQNVCINILRISK